MLMQSPGSRRVSCEKGPESWARILLKKCEGNTCGVEQKRSVSWLAKQAIIRFTTEAKRSGAEARLAFIRIDR